MRSAIWRHYGSFAARFATPITAALSPGDWTRAVREGRVRTTTIGPMKHHADGGYFDVRRQLPDGQSYLERSAEAVVQTILAHHNAG